MPSISIPHVLKMCAALILLPQMLTVCAHPAPDILNQLRDWRKGVWISGRGTYTVYTDQHYFVVSVEGSSNAPNVYCGASQVVYHRRGMARQQTLRLRQLPGQDMQTFSETHFLPEHAEASLVVDTTLFVPGTCNIVDGVIYDAITEVTAEHIMLSTCNGDKEKILANGVSVYMPADGGEFYSYRVSSL